MEFRFYFIISIFDLTPLPTGFLNYKCLIQSKNDICPLQSSCTHHPIVFFRYTWIGSVYRQYNVGDHLQQGLNALNFNLKSKLLEMLWTWKSRQSERVSCIRDGTFAWQLDWQLHPSPNKHQIIKKNTTLIM